MKSAVWVGVFVGSSIGSAVPMLWGGSLFSMSSMLFSALGAFAGIWAVYKLYM